MRHLKTIILGVLILSAAVLLARPPRLRETIPPGRVEIRYWEKWSGKEADQMKEIVDDFNRTVGKEKGIWCSYISMSSVDQKTLTATAAGDPPDVAGVWDAQITQFAAMNALEPLDDWAKAAGITRGDYLKPVFYDGCSYNGHLYGLPSTPGGVALHYNKKIFRDKAKELRAAGLDPDRPPRTIDELDRYSAVLDTWDKNGNLIAAGFLPQEPGWWMSLMSYWFQGDVYDPKTRKVTFTDPHTVAAYKWVEGYVKRLGPQTIQSFRAANGKDNFDSPISPFFTGAVAMEMEGPWKANYVKKYAAKLDNPLGLSEEELAKLPRDERRKDCDWGAAPFPDVAGEDNIGYASMDVFVIPKSGRHKKEAFEFIAFVNRADEMEKLVSLHCKTSPLAKMSDQYIRNHPNPYIEVFEELNASPKARSLPSLPVWPEVKAELDYAADRISNGEATAEQALQDAQVRAQAKVDQFFERQNQREALKK
ncbi:MAG TPA: ABC transporter substrate-binding protein [Tepidisphaeraceae bacterium]|jgi:ABC-type glycerol-3-phosphate transport system substrate-binding protein